MKRSLAAGSRPDAGGHAVLAARESALLLLARSIDFGHGRLALIRLSMAAQAGADIPPQHWDYCRDTASRSQDITLRDLFLRAERAAAAPRPPDSTAEPAKALDIQNSDDAVLQLQQPESLQDMERLIHPLPRDPADGGNLFLR